MTNWEKLFMPLVEKWRSKILPDCTCLRCQRTKQYAAELLAHLRESGVVERVRAEALEEAADFIFKNWNDKVSVAIVDALRAKAKLLGKGAE